MARSHASSSLVSLPHLSAPNAITLCTQLLTVAEAHHAHLPPVLGKAAERLAGSAEALRDSRARIEEVKTLDPSAAFAADVRVDAACAAFYGFLQGWARLPSPGPWAEKAALAQLLLDKLYPHGLAFTQMPFMTEWAEVQQLLGRADLSENAERIAKLGGETFVEAIRATFETYGEALQVTKWRAEVKASVRVREPLDALVASLRSYVLRVRSHAEAGDDLSDPEARELAEALLAPLTAWRASGGRKEKAGGEQERE